MMLSKIDKFSIVFLLLIIAFLWIIFRSIFVLIPTAIILVGMVWGFFGKKKSEQDSHKPTPITEQHFNIRMEREWSTPFFISLLDKRGIVAKAPNDIEISLSSTKNKIASPWVKIPAGCSRISFAKSKPIVSDVFSAKIKGLKDTNITLNLETGKFCIYEGDIIPLGAKYCPYCGRLQSSNGDNIKCISCDHMIPTIAYNCPTCGAHQPKK